MRDTAVYAAAEATVSGIAATSPRAHALPPRDVTNGVVQEAREILRIDALEFALEPAASQDSAL